MRRRHLDRIHGAVHFMRDAPSTVNVPLPLPRAGTSNPIHVVWCMIASFGAYACMYGFRKPFTAGSYPATDTIADLKTWLVTAQVLGYTLAKFAGIRVIAEMRAENRARVLIGMVALAEVALVAFAVLPPKSGIACLFLNGLSLGMVFGLVLGFLEGRRMTEAFVAGLCTSFILADGLTKSVGAGLLRAGVPTGWMPAAAGALFFLPLIAFVWMLTRIPRPTEGDIAARAERMPMQRTDRLRFLRRHGWSLALIVVAYVLVTVIRSIRADYAPELWASLGIKGQPGIFTRSELWVALGILLINGCSVFVKDNRRAFIGSILLSMAGLSLVLASLVALHWQVVAGFGFMVLLGLGLYIPYVAVHTTVFERFIALTQERSNLGFLMYLADAFGYLGFVAVLTSRDSWKGDPAFLPFFSRVCAGGAVVGLMAFAGALATSRLIPRVPEAA